LALEQDFDRQLIARPHRRRICQRHDFQRIADDGGKAGVGGRDVDQRLGEFLDYIRVGSGAWLSV
jgi:hypothetical protein